MGMPDQTETGRRMGWTVSSGFWGLADGVGEGWEGGCYVDGSAFAPGEADFDVEAIGSGDIAGVEGWGDGVGEFLLVPELCVDFEDAAFFGAFGLLERNLHVAGAHDHPACDL